MDTYNLALSCNIPTAVFFLVLFSCSVSKKGKNKQTSANSILIPFATLVCKGDERKGFFVRLLFSNRKSAGYKVDVLPRQCLYSGRLVF